ncbi:hypothetical protein B5S28_g5096 [[Candida] boidinii]|uniref:Unnamed protein product n=1 Tax=Candida boidinii TaxID=5477 RepID=A0ACB5TQS8_CANBO|nr:hypothetical protein B5S28_g5096 [[Candida] boidinii]OWB63970.1 hypothetical protein B5S29_g4992 [[Candida] boidinii]OWB75220.1 hypothetical protein B5S31_g5088 [[Candida] boidinii]OWB80965.1 hypothetical protein B5S32_g5298 [[Candida] boidinii]GME86451.1 unnamed protein product [[Candida] boidinii]
MKFSVVAASLFAAQALAVSSVWETTTKLSTTTSTDTECAETVTDCPARKGNDTEGPSTYEGAAAGLSGSFAAVAGAALVAGAVLGL